MKKILNCVLVSFILVTPLFSALLSNDLHVVTPAGMPFKCEDLKFNQRSQCNTAGVQLHFVETSQGIMIVREYLGEGSSWSVQNMNDMHNGEGHLAIKSNPLNGSQGKPPNIEVNLE